MEILILILLTLLSGLFAMSEISVVSSRRFKLENAAKRGDKGASKALELADSPGKFLSTVQIGITLIGIVMGSYTGENFNKPVADLLAQVGWLQPYATEIAKGIVILFTTFLSIVLGELFPKRIGMSFPETVAAMISRPMYWLSRITAPFVWLLTKTNDLLLLIFGINAHTDSIVTEEEIKSMISESAESGQIKEIEQDIVERVFALGDRKVSALMTHRSDLIWLDLKDDAAAIKAVVKQEPHNVYPVADDELDNMQGFVLVKDLLLNINEKDFSLNAHIREALFVPGNLSAYKLLDEFRQKRQHYAIVVDEFGAVEGIVTMDDLLDALVGDVSKEEQQEYLLEELGPDNWLADGQYPFHELMHQLDSSEEEYSDGDFTTVAGLVIHQLDAMPRKGDVCLWHGYRFEVVAMNKRRVEKVKITRE